MESCIIRLADSTSLRCPAYPDECTWAGRAHGDGQIYRRFEWQDWQDNPMGVLGDLLREKDTPVETLIEDGREIEDECVLELEDGRSIRCPALGEPCLYVRIVGTTGDEEAYWDEVEFRDDPTVVMGAFFGAASAATQIVEE
jgi:hypothetical protein